MKVFILLSVLALAVHAEIDCTHLEDGIYGWGCRSYTSCKGGVGTQVDCPHDLVFNYLTNGCDTPRNTPPPCGVYRDCKNKPDGKYADTLLKCTSFYTCINGEFFGHNPCIPGTVFNEKLQICDWPENVEPPCGTLVLKSTTEAPEPETTPAPEPETTAAPEPHTTAAPEPKTTAAPEPTTTEAPETTTTKAPPRGDCKNRSDGRYADKTVGCKAFFTCLDGINVGSQHCVPGTVFNDEIQVCDWPDHVLPPCGTLVVPTTEEPETTQKPKTTTVVAVTTESEEVTTESESAESTEVYEESNSSEEDNSEEQAPLPALYKRIEKARGTTRRPTTRHPTTPRRPSTTPRRPSTTTGRPGTTRRF